MAVATVVGVDDADDGNRSDADLGEQGFFASVGGVPTTAPAVLSEPAADDPFSILIKALQKDEDSDSGTVEEETKEASEDQKATQTESQPNHWLVEMIRGTEHTTVKFLETDDKITGIVNKLIEDFSQKKAQSQES